MLLFGRRVCLRSQNVVGDLLLQSQKAKMFSLLNLLHYVLQLK